MTKSPKPSVHRKPKSGRSNVDLDKEMYGKYLKKDQNLEKQLAKALNHGHPIAVQLLQDLVIDKPLHAIEENVQNKLDKNGKRNLPIMMTKYCFTEDANLLHRPADKAMCQRLKKAALPPKKPKE